MNSLEIKLASSEPELIEIKNLQNKNLKENISIKEKQSEGFLTANYTLEFLKKLNNKTPAIIIKNEKVVGYAIAASKEVAKEHKLLNNLVYNFDKQLIDGNLLSNQSYIVVGQLCIEKKYRGFDYVKKLYSFFKDTYSTYRYCVTAVDIKNVRSLKAHKKCGFIKIGELKLNNNPGDIILWDWKNKPMT